jgi:hypothetical protein
VISALCGYECKQGKSAILDSNTTAKFLETPFLIIGMDLQHGIERMVTYKSDPAGTGKSSGFKSVVWIFFPIAVLMKVLLPVLGSTTTLFFGFWRYCQLEGMK